MMHGTYNVKSVCVFYVFMTTSMYYVVYSWLTSYVSFSSTTCQSVKGPLIVQNMFEKVWKKLKT